MTGIHRDIIMRLGGRELGGLHHLAKMGRIRSRKALVIGVTVAAFGTSSPELMVTVGAAVEGVPAISLGDVLGSNVLNISLILGLVLSVAA
ncbi:MAG: hypothetical protein ABIS50_23635 [Luteolibacter sp.]|uniref:hypothetical protein n=1 Tax=Luteolibacter sp. TaxID=1962973 RepID=UPI003263B374